MMPSWVEEEARAEAMLYREGPELWRDLKASIKKAVEDYTRIYSPPGKREVQCMDCQSASENCIRVCTLLPPAIAFDITFDTEMHKIASVADNMEFSLVVKDGEITIRGPQGELESLEDASKTILKPLFAKLPRRRPKIDF